MKGNATADKPDTSGDVPSCLRPPRRLAVFGWFTVGLIAGATATSGLTAYVHGGMKRGFGRGLDSVEQVQERIADRAAWVIGSIDVIR